MPNGRVLDFIGEERDVWENCSTAAGATFKFFDQIRVEFGDDSSPYASVHFGKSYEDDCVEREIAKQVRAYVKEQKRWIRENAKGADPEELRKKVFWMITMLLEHGIFSPSHQSKIQIYAQFVWDSTKDY